MRLLILLFFFWNATAAADEVTICYNYGCAVKADVKITGKQMLQIKQLFIQVPDSQAERRAISQAIGLFETFSGEQTPTSHDKGAMSLPPSRKAKWKYTEKSLRRVYHSI